MSKPLHPMGGEPVPLVTPLAVGADKAIQLRRQRAPRAQASPEVKAKPVIQATAG